MARLISDKEIASLWDISPKKVSQALPPLLRKTAILMRYDFRRTMLLIFEAMDNLDERKPDEMGDREFAARYDMLTGRETPPRNGKAFSR